MSAAAEAMIWAQRILARKDAAPHVLLDLRENATLDEAQNAFHKIAKKAHPDLHRHALSPEDFETLTSAYSKVAGAYQTFRSSETTTKNMRPLPAREVHVQSADKPATGPASQMSSRALVYYRKAELALRRGDLTGSVLQLKMAIAADPNSAFLRTALAEVEAEIAKG